MKVQELLEAIAALPADERQSLLARLREIYLDVPPVPAASRPRLERGDWEREADYMLVFDGGSRGNPGPAYGSYIIFNAKGSGRAERIEFPDPLTNNQAEYHTLLAGLRDLAARLGGHGPAQAVLVVRGDSQLVIEQLAGRYQVRDEALRPLWAEAGELLRVYKRFHLVWQSREDTLALLGH